MLTMEETDGGLLRIHADGQLTTEDYVDFVTRLEWFAKGCSAPIAMLIELGPGFGGWSLDALFRDHKFNLRSGKPVSRVAIVADARWEKWGSGALYSLLAKETRFFDLARKAEAEEWLCAAPSGPAG